jgi:hypothetical protein
MNTAAISAAKSSMISIHLNWGPFIKIRFNAFNSRTNMNTNFEPGVGQWWDN